MLDVEVVLKIKVHHLEPPINKQEEIGRQELQNRVDVKAFKLKEEMEKKIKKELGLNN